MSHEGLLMTLAGGTIGGALVETLKWGRWLQSNKSLENWRRIAGGSLLLALLGGAYACVNSTEVSWDVAVKMGAAAPALVGAWASGRKARPPAARNGKKDLAPPVDQAASRWSDLFSWW